MGARVQHRDRDADRARRVGIAGRDRVRDRQATAVRTEGQLVYGRSVGRRLERGDAPPRAGIEQRNPARDVADRQRALVGAERGGQDALGVGAQDPYRGWALEQRGKQVATRLHGVVHRHALAREQERAIEVVLDEGARPRRWASAAVA